MRKPPLWAIGSALVAVVAGAIVAGRLGDDEGNVEVGDRFAASSSDVVGHEVVVQIPYGRWAFTVAEPVEEVLSRDLESGASAALDDGAESIRAPEGSSIVEVEAAPDLTTPYQAPPPFAGAPVTTQPPPTAQAALVVDGEEFDLGITYSGVRTETKSVYVVVPGAADKLSLDAVALRITVDGEAQTVAVTDGGEDDFGAAATLYEQHSAGFECPATMSASSTAAGFYPSLVDCEGAAGQYPYHPELGWAGEGATWTWVWTNVFRSLSWESAAGDEVFCPVETVTTGVQLGDEMPDAFGEISTSIALAVFRSADLPSAVTLSLVFSCTVDPESTELELPATLSATYDITIELPWE